MVHLQRTQAPRNFVSDSPVSLLQLSGCEENRGGPGTTDVVSTDPAVTTSTNTLVANVDPRGNVAVGPITAPNAITSATHRLSRHLHNTHTQTVAAHVCDVTNDNRDVVDETALC